MGFLILRVHGSRLERDWFMVFQGLITWLRAWPVDVDKVVSLQLSFAVYWQEQINQIFSNDLCVPLSE